MDPTATLADILDTFADTTRAWSLEDRDEVIDLMDSLADWIKRGGFVPAIQQTENGAITTYTIDLSHT